MLPLAVLLSCSSFDAGQSGVEGLQARLEEQLKTVRARLDTMEAEIGRLRQRLGPEQVERQVPLTAGGERQPLAESVSPLGESPSRPGRQLSAASTCCRWTPDDTCNVAGGDSTALRKCTSLHEYLEHKTTTHVFEDLDACLGTDPALWTASFDGANQSVSLSNQAVVKTPLRVTHAANCSGDPPVLTVQHQTVHELDLSMNAAVTLDGALLLGPPRYALRHTPSGGSSSEGCYLYCNIQDSTALKGANVESVQRWPPNTDTMFEFRPIAGTSNVALFNVWSETYVGISSTNSLDCSATSVGINETFTIIRPGYHGQASLGASHEPGPGSVGIYNPTHQKYLSANYNSGTCGLQTSAIIGAWEKWAYMAV